MAEPTEELVQRLRLEIDDFSEEVGAAYERLVLPSEPHLRGKFVQTLYAYMARCFSILDFYAQCAYPHEGDQTRRMVDFLESRLGVSREAANVAVKIWRHTLMHTAKPSMVLEETSGMNYTWLLHWGRELPEEDHFQVKEVRSALRKLDLALLYLVRDLRRAVHGYLDEIGAFGSSQVDFLEGLATITQDTAFKVR